MIPSIKPLTSVEELLRYQQKRCKKPLKYPSLRREQQNHKTFLTLSYESKSSHRINQNHNQNPNQESTVSHNVESVSENICKIFTKYNQNIQVGFKPAKPN